MLGETKLGGTKLGGTNLGRAGNGTSATNGIAIAVNASGIVYIGGNTPSNNHPVTTSGLVLNCSSDTGGVCNLTGWVAAFDPSKTGAASLFLSTYLTGSSAGTDSNGNNLRPISDVNALTIDGAGNTIVTGDTSATSFPTTAGTLQPACVKHGDGNGNANVCSDEAFVTKMTSAGALVWSTFFGPTSAAGFGSSLIGQGIATDANNNVYVVMQGGLGSIPTMNPIAANAGGNPDVYFAELNPTGTTLLMGTFLGTVGGIGLNTITLHLDSNLNAYFSANQGMNRYGGTSFPITSNAANKIIQGNDGWVVKMNTQQQASVTALTVTPNPATPLQSVTLTATVTTPSTLTGTALSTGTITFLNGTTTIGTGTLNAAGMATYTRTLSAATYSVTANYAGDAGFNISVSQAATLTLCSAVNTTTALTVTLTTSTYGTSTVLTATVLAGTAPVAVGSVSFNAAGVSLGSATVNAQAVAAVTVKPNTGLYSVLASYAGTYSAANNPNGYGPGASIALPLTLSKAASVTTLTTSSNSVEVGASFTLTLLQRCHLSWHREARNRQNSHAFCCNCSGWDVQHHRHRRR